MTTVLLWGDRWWLPRQKMPVPFAELAQAAAMLATAWPEKSRTLRVVYQPDDFATVPVTCPNTNRAMLALALAEDHPVVAHPGLVWGYEPILAAGESFNTLLHHETRPALFALIQQLEESGFLVDSVWPLPTWLNALPPDLSDSGAMTIVALQADRYCLYRHSPEGVRSVHSGSGATVLDAVAGHLREVFARSAAEFVLYVVSDDGLLDRLNQQLPLVENRIVGVFSLWEALAKPAPLSCRHPAQLLPPGARFRPARVVLMASMLALSAGAGLFGHYGWREVTNRRAEAALAAEIPALRAEVGKRRQAGTEFAELRAALGADQPGPAVFAPWLRSLGQMPTAVTLTALQLSPGEVTLTGGVTQPEALTESAWREWLAVLNRGPWRISPVPLPTGGFTLKGSRS